ncbi:MAG TPA: TauD/TfdA family dioxygenase [Sphingobium sp.]|nr:TauD/TfdA family dioxygenase [Sphingobium sp.]
MLDQRDAPHGVFENSAANCRHIEVRPLASSMGAEIRNLDVNDLSDEAFQELRGALFRHRMIYLRGQRLDHDQQAAFTRRFGEFGADSFASDTDAHPHVLPVIKEAEARAPLVFGGGWHTDSPFLPRPPAITILRSIETPPLGGDTIWADTALAFRALSPTMQAMLEPLRVRMSAEKAAALVALVKASGAPLPGYGADAVRDKAFARTPHPLVRTHPETGEKALYIDDSYAVDIEGLTASESRPLIDFLVAHITQHAFTCRLRWEPDMLVLWDNRLCLHLAMNDYDGHRREMYRTTVMGEVPS